MNQPLPWLRWWDSAGNLLLSGEERAEQERQARLDAVSRLQLLGLTVEQITEALSLSEPEVRAVMESSR